MNSKKISVIIPCRNGAHTLSRCVDSILAQTYKNFEVIIVINDSSDNYTELIKDYIQKDNRIKYIVIQQSGVSHARNHGLKLVTGDYVQFIDADDDIQPHMFEKLITTAVKTKADMVTFKFNHDCWKAFLPAGTYHLHNPKEGFKLYSDFFTFELPWNKLVRRKAITKPFDEKVGIYEGSLFYLDNHKGIRKVVVLDDVLYNYYNAGGSAKNLSIVNDFLKSRFWENKTSYWHKFYALDKRFRKAIKAVYQSSPNTDTERFVHVRLFDLAFVELVKLVYSDIPASIIAQEMHNIFNEPALIESASFFGYNVCNPDLAACEEFVAQCFKEKNGEAECFYKYIELFSEIICASNDIKMPKSFDTVLESIVNE